jgi:multisubunit Na+/H+ antiporter MnhG subunit
MSRTLVVIGLICVAAGLLWPFIGKLGLGRLPGDIYIERSNYSFYFPIATSLVISIVLSVVVWLVNR